ncbi:vacuolar-type H+-ATPase subunit E/Vma4 [Methanolinea mesophila]|uniref:V-type ATP synthase subunit E n=1 Tax=Methanolinea mesophila TaxID=547055 RepID=UPI001AEA46AA|nr:V-type ATP synthase subunit E family protein [Methanolinea mesophila]MBP1927533.1 vacuolar-type H+-ATPase subunit E/Vma4 [Methanolinea mesophila]
MSLEAIEERIRKDAEEEARIITSTAEEEAKGIIARAAKDAEREYASLHRSESKKTEISVQQTLSQARMDSRNTVREFRDSLVAGCFSRAEESLLSVRNSPEYGDIFRHLLEEALDILGTGKAEISVHPEDRQLAMSVAESFPGEHISLTVTGNSLDTTGGMILAAPERKITVDNTFEARRERLKRALIIETSDILFPVRGGRT